MHRLDKQSEREAGFALLLTPSDALNDEVASRPLSYPSKVAPWEADHNEGKLAVDIAETDNEIFIVSTIAGVVFDKIDVYLHNDLLTIHGERENPLAGTGVEYAHAECFWGSFSRTIVLPSEVKAEQAQAEYKNGLLTIRIPKRKVDARIPVRIVEE